MENTTGKERWKIARRVIALLLCVVMVYACTPIIPLSWASEEEPAQEQNGNTQPAAENEQPAADDSQQQAGDPEVNAPAGDELAGGELAGSNQQTGLPESEELENEEEPMDSVEADFAAPTAKTGLVFSGTLELKKLVNEGTSDDWRYTFQYKVGTDDWSSAIPRRSAADTYKVSWRQIRLTNGNVKRLGEFNVTIAPLDISNANKISFAKDTLAFTGQEQGPTISSVKWDQGDLDIPLTDSSYELSGDVKATAVGDYTMKITFKGNFTGSTTKAWSIVDFSKAKVTFNPSSRTYNGQSQSVSISKVTLGSKTLSLNTDYTVDSSSVLSATDVGTYTVKLNGAGTYAGMSTTATWEMKQATPSATVNAVGDLFANGGAQTLVTGSATSGCSLEYKVSTSALSSDDGTGWSSTATATAADTYYVYYRIKGNKNYADVGFSKSNVCMVAIHAFTAPEANSLTFNGLPQVLVKAGTVDSSILYYIQYKVDSGDWSEIVPSKTNAATYAVKWQLLKRPTTIGGHSTLLKEGNFNVTIAQKNIAANVEVVLDPSDGILAWNNTEQGPTVSKVIYHSSELTQNELTLNEDYTIGGTTKATDKGDYNLTINLKGNYTGTVTVPWKISADIADATITLNETVPYTYNGQDQTVSIKSVKFKDVTLVAGTDYTVDASSKFTGKDVGTYTIKLNGINNFAGQSKTLEWKINKATPKANVTVAQDSTYNGSKKTLASGTADFGATIQYCVFKSDAGVIYDDKVVDWGSAPEVTNAGYYKIYYRVVGSDNWNAVDSTLAGYVHIEKAQITANVTATQTTYNGTAQCLISSASCSHGTLEYRTSLLSGWTNLKPAETDAGIYPVYYNVEGDANHIGTSGMVTAVIEQAEFKASYVKLVPAEGTTLPYTYNGSKQSVGVKVEIDGTEIPGTEWYVANKEILGKTYGSVTEATDADTYTIYVTTVFSTDKNFKPTVIPVHWKINPLDISTATVEFNDLEYNGTEQDVSIKSIKINGLTLTSDDYTLSGDIKAKDVNTEGSYQVTITGKGNFTGSVTGEWNIKPATLKSEWITLDQDVLLWNDGWNQGPNFKVVNDADVKLKAETDFTVKSGTTGEDPNVYTLTLEGMGNYQGQATMTWVITKNYVAEIAAPAVADLTYTGQAQSLLAAEAAVTVLNKETLAEVESLTVPVEYKLGTDGTYATGYSNIKATDADTYDIYYRVNDFKGATADASYKGLEVTTPVQATIKKADLSTAQITLNKDEFTYSGHEFTASVKSVEWNSMKLDLNDDYTITSGTKGTDAKTYTLVITAAADSNFTGTASKQWKINPFDISAEGITYGTVVDLGASLTYNGKVQTQTISSVKYYYGLIPTYDITYTVSGNTGKDAGKYTMTITGTGNFTGSVNKDFWIAKATPNPNLEPAKNLVYNGEAQTLITSDPDFGTVEYRIYKNSLLNMVQDYTAGDPQYTDAGTYYIYWWIEGNDNWNSVGNVLLPAPVVIEQAEFTADMVTLVSADDESVVVSEDAPLMYNGKEQAVKVIVKDKNGNPISHKEWYVAGGKVGDFEYISHLKGTNANAFGDTYDVYVTTLLATNDNYKDTVIKKSWTIAPLDIADADITLGGDVLIANGTEQRQKIESVKIGDLDVTYLVKPGTDKGTKAGIYTMKLKGYGNFTGKTTKSWLILGTDGEDEGMNIDITVVSDGNIVGSFDSNMSEFIASICTPEELSRVAAGEPLNIMINIDAAGSTSEEMQEAIKALTGNANNAAVLDITLWKQIGADDPQQVTESALCTFTIAIPESIVNTNPNATRSYYVLRNHEGEIATLSSSYNAEKNTVTFSTNQFSEYAIAYTDVIHPAVPKTGDNAMGLMVALMLLILAAGSCLGGAAYRRRRD